MNLLGVLTITMWAFLWNLPLLLLLKHFGVLRVDEEMETFGLDAMEHSEEAYPSADWGERPPDAVTNMDQLNKAESVSPASGRGIRTDQHLSNDMILIKSQYHTYYIYSVHIDLLRNKRTRGKQRWEYGSILIKLIHFAFIINVL